MSLQQKRTVQTQTSEPTWAKVVAQGKPSQSQNISVVSFIGYTNDIGPIPERGTSVGIGRLSRETKYEFRSDNGSILTQRAIEKKNKLDFAKKQKQVKESNKQKPEQPKPKPQEPELEQPKTKPQEPELKTKTKTQKPNKPLTKIELRKRAEIQKAKEDAALLRELVKISRLPKDKQEKLYDELLSRK